MEQVGQLFAARRLVVMTFGPRFRPSGRDGLQAGGCGVP
jgi:hypothetical protein